MHLGTHTMSSKLSPGSKNTKSALVKGHFICSLSSLQFPWLLFPYPSSPLIPWILISRNLWIFYGNIPLASRAHVTVSLSLVLAGSSRGESAKLGRKLCCVATLLPSRRGLLTMGLALALWGVLALTPGSPAHSCSFCRAQGGTSDPHRQLAQSTCMARTQEQGSPWRTDWFFHLNSIPKHRLLIERAVRITEFLKLLLVT